MDQNVRKVIELICAALPARGYEQYDSVGPVTLTESDFKRQGISIDMGAAILKHELSHDYAVFDVGEIYEADLESFDGDSRVYGQNCITFMSHPSIYKSLINSSDKKSSKEYPIMRPTLDRNRKISNDIIFCQ